MKKGKIFIISGPSGSGKTTLYKKLLVARRSLSRSISVTTRLPRKGEKNGRDYIFITKKMYDYKKKCGHFLETEKVFDNYYGTTKKGVRDILANGKHILLCIDVKGAKAVKRKFPEAIRIFVKTRNLDILGKRLKTRDSEDQKTVKLRLDTAGKELKEEEFYDYVIVNDQLDKAYKHLLKIIDQELGKRPS